MAYPGHGAEEECQEKRSTKAINQDREQADAPRTDRAFARVGASRFPRFVFLVEFFQVFQRYPWLKLFLADF